MSRISAPVRIAIRMRMPVHFALIALVLFAGSLRAPADDRPRMAISVNRKTIVRPLATSRTGEESGRVQAMTLTATNNSIRSLPEGKVDWTIVVRKVSGDLVKYSGSAQLPALRASKSAEIQFGSIEVGATQTAASVERDKVDYEIIVSHDGKETQRTTSSANFAVLASKAVAVAGAVNLDEDAPPKRKPVAEDVKKPEAPAKTPVVPIAAEKLPPVAPKGSDVPKTPVETPVPQQPFDFFNLGGKKAPEPK